MACTSVSCRTSTTRGCSSQTGRCISLLSPNKQRDDIFVKFPMILEQGSVKSLALPFKVRIIRIIFVDETSAANFFS